MSNLVVPRPTTKDGNGWVMTTTPLASSSQSRFPDLYDVPAGSKKLVLDTRNTLATLVQYFAVEYG